MRVLVAVESRPWSLPLSSERALKARKSEHCRPATSMIWIYSPALTSYDSTLARLTRNSSLGSVKGSGRRSATGRLDDGAADVDQDVGGRGLLERRHRPRPAPRRRRRGTARRAAAPPRPASPSAPNGARGQGPAEVEAAPLQPGPHAPRVLAVAGQDGLQTGGRARRGEAEGARGFAAGRIEDDQFDRLQAFQVDQFERVVGVEGEGVRAAALDDVALAAGRQRRQARLQHGRASRRGDQRFPSCALSPSILGSWAGARP